MNLNNVDISQEPITALHRSMSSWPKVAGLLYGGMPEESVLKLLKVEILGRNRPYVATRIHSRYLALRSIRERKEVQEYAKRIRKRN